MHLAAEWVLGLMPWTLLLPLALVHAARAWRVPSARFVLLWLLIPPVVIALSHHPRHRYLLPIYPAAALLIARWADARSGPPSAAERGLGWLALAGALAAACWPVWLKPAPDRFLPGDLPTAVALTVGPVAIGTLLFWGLRRGRRALVVHGTAAIMAAVLAVGVWPYIDWANHAYQWRHLGEVVARDVEERDMAAFFGTRRRLVDFYAGIQLPRILTVQELNRYLAQPDHPLALVDARRWSRVRAEGSPSLRVKERVRAGADDILIVEDAGVVPPAVARDPGQR
jgi:4-amino-4-deoxy-L-arabinose transferase-like glycosyltransferase